MKGIITWGSTYSKLNIDANLKVSDLNNSKVLIATNVGPILQIFTKKHHLGGVLWAQPAAYAGQKEVPTRAENQHTAGKLVQLVQLVLPDPKFWRTHAALLFFFCVFFFPWVFGAVWKFLATEIQHPRKNANSLKLKKYFLQICGWKLLVVLPFFFSKFVSWRWSRWT